MSCSSLRAPQFAGRLDLRVSHRSLTQPARPSNEGSVGNRRLGSRRLPVPCTHAARAPLAWPGPPAAPPGPRAPPRPACPPARPSEHLARLVLLQAAEAPHHQALQQQDGQRGGDCQLVTPHQLLHPRARHHLPARDAGRASGPANRPRACARTPGRVPLHTPPTWAGKGRGTRPHPLVGWAGGRGRSAGFGSSRFESWCSGSFPRFHACLRVGEPPPDRKSVVRGCGGSAA